MSGVLLDTHALLWLLQGSLQMGRKSRALAERARKSNRLLVSAVSYWEIARLLNDGRIRLGIEFAAWRLQVRQYGISELPLSADAAIRAADVQTEHGDPMDYLIVGAALASGTTLLTADGVLLRWRGPLLRQDASL